MSCQPNNIRICFQMFRQDIFNPIVGFKGWSDLQKLVGNSRNRIDIVFYYAVGLNSSLS